MTMLREGRPQFFRGRPITVDGNGYPQVVWPEHPAARSNGTVPIHRVIAYETWGPGILELDIHHFFGLWDWRPQALCPLTTGEHAYLHAELRHAPNRETRACAQCGCAVELRTAQRRSRERVYCSPECFRRGIERIEWPPVDELLERLEEMSYVEFGRLLGVSDNAVRKRIRVHGEVAPPRKRRTRTIREK